MALFLGMITDVMENHLMAPRSFNAQWNLWNKIKDDVHFSDVK